MTKDTSDLNKLVTLYREGKTWQKASKLTGVDPLITKIFWNHFEEQ